MRALLDTNIVIHRENKRASNYSVGHLYRWLDKLRYDKIIHPYSVSEIKKYKDVETQEAFEIKLDAYNVLQTIIEPSEEFLRLIGLPERTPNDRIDDTLLYEVFLGRVDILITEDRKLREKAIKIDLEDRVFSARQLPKTLHLLSMKCLPLRRHYSVVLMSTIVFLIVFAWHIMVLISGLCVSAMKRRTFVKMIPEVYWDFSI